MKSYFWNPYGDPLKPHKCACGGSPDCPNREDHIQYAWDELARASKWSIGSGNPYPTERIKAWKDRYA